MLRDPRPQTDSWTTIVVNFANQPAPVEVETTLAKVIWEGKRSILPGLTYQLFRYTSPGGLKAYWIGTRDSVVAAGYLPRLVFSEDDLKKEFDALFPEQPSFYLQTIKPLLKSTLPARPMREVVSDFYRDTLQRG